MCERVCVRVFFRARRRRRGVVRCAAKGRAAFAIRSECGRVRRAPRERRGTAARARMPPNTAGRACGEGDGASHTSGVTAGLTWVGRHLRRHIGLERRHPRGEVRRARTRTCRAARVCAAVRRGLRRWRAGPAVPRRARRHLRRHLKALTPGTWRGVTPGVKCARHVLCAVPYRMCSAPSKCWHGGGPLGAVWGSEPFRGLEGLRILTPNLVISEFRFL